MALPLPRDELFQPYRLASQARVVADLAEPAPVFLDTILSEERPG
jgi:hypothetical protein